MSSEGSSFMRIRGDGEAPLQKLGRTLSRPWKVLGQTLKNSNLVDKSTPYLAGFTRFGVSSISSFWNDPFHSLLNLPWTSFITVFFFTYFIQYIAFAFLYWMQGNCVLVNINTQVIQGNTVHAITDNSFQRSLWMSSRVASTLGFSEIRPDPECNFINVSVMIQVIFGSLVNFILLGVVFARFSAPFKRASTVRFSKLATVSRHPSGFWALTLRVANLRKHQILQPQVRLMVTAADSITPSFYHHEELQIEEPYKQLTNLELGFPAHITHVITPNSFLYNLSLLEMDTRNMEVLVFVDGIDAMTSRFMSARVAYSTSDVYMNEMFAPMNLEMRGKRLGLNFVDFDKTVPALDPALLLDTSDEGMIKTENNLWALRHQTFKKLAEKYAHLGVSHSAAVAAAATGGADAQGDGKVSVPTTPTMAAAAAAANSADTHGLLDRSVPSHIAPSSLMTASTSGMPFAVGKASAQTKDAKLAALFGQKAGGAGSAWTSIHSSAHVVDMADTNGNALSSSGGGARSTPAGSADTDAFVPIAAVQRGTAGSGNAWQSAGMPAAINPLPGMGAPAIGLSTSAGGNSTSQAQQGGLPNDPNLYSLEEENPSAEQDPLAGPARPSLPTSTNPFAPR